MRFFRQQHLAIGLAFASGMGALLEAQNAAAPQAVVTIDAVTDSQHLREGIHIKAGAATLRFTALRDDIIRVRISPGETLP